jgi:Asp-tRNA(Asn)/Glu-tRNA(Gln) amidotransferase A subunit family amidase
MCGVVGLKATYGRISERGAAPLCWSLAHLGPIGVTTEDVALTYDLVAGPDSKDPVSLRQPPPALGNWAQDDLEGVTLGVYRDWFEHASPEIVSACDAMVKRFVLAGAKVEEIEIPNLDLMRIAQAVTILSEMATAMEKYSKYFRRHAPAVQINLLAGREFKARHYVLAQQVRTVALRTMASTFERVDAIITPTTAVTAPAIPEHSARTGWSNINSVTEIMRYVFLGNLTGNPAISFPAGYDSKGLPIGMQAMTKHWNEQALLRISWVAEQNFERKLPSTFFRSLA